MSFLVKLCPRTATELGPLMSSLRTCRYSAGMTVSCQRKSLRRMYGLKRCSAMNCPSEPENSPASRRIVDRMLDQFETDASQESFIFGGIEARVVKRIAWIGTHGFALREAGVEHQHAVHTGV